MSYQIYRSMVNCFTTLLLHLLMYYEILTFFLVKYCSFLKTNFTPTEKGYRKISFHCCPTYCTDEILISDVNSYKSFLTIIYMCLKLYCHKYVANFNFILFMWPRCCYLMFHPAPPPVSATHFNPLITSAAPPLSSHQV